MGWMKRPSPPPITCGSSPPCAMDHPWIPRRSYMWFSSWRTEVLFQRDRFEEFREDQSHAYFEMDAYRFPVDHAEHDGAADNGSIVVIEPGASERWASECCRVATRDRVGSDGSTGCFAARQPGSGATRSRGISHRFD